MVTKEVKKLKDYTISEINEFLKAVNDIPNVTAFLCRDTKQIMLDYRVEGNTVRYCMNDEVDFKELTKPRKTKLGVAEMRQMVVYVGKIEGNDLIALYDCSPNEYYIEVKSRLCRDNRKMSYDIPEDDLYRNFIKCGFEPCKSYLASEVFDCCDDYSIEVY